MKDNTIASLCLLTILYVQTSKILIKISLNCHCIGRPQMPMFLKREISIL